MSNKIIVIQEGVYKYRTPWWFCISLAWKIQKESKDGYGLLRFVIQGHQVLCFKSWNINYPLWDVLYLFPGIRIKWEISRDITLQTVSIIIEDHKVFSFSDEFLNMIEGGD